MKGFATKAVHGDMQTKDMHGALRMPLYDSVAFEHESAKEIQQSFEGKKPSHSYSRISNPSVEDFEQRIRLLFDALGVIAVSSGMAAIANVLLTLGQAGANIVTSRFLFGNTFSLFEKTLKPWGLEARYIDMTDVQALEKSIDENTCAVFFEVITNPQLQVADVGKIAGIAEKYKIPVILDGTLTTPYIFKSNRFGVDIEVISSTKYISGGATTVGGLIIDYGTFDWEDCARLAEDAGKFGDFTLLLKLRREVYRNLGACLAPHNACMQKLGLETLSLRIDKSCINALEIARALEKNAKVKSVNYPGLRSSQYHETAKAQFNDKFGGILTFELNNRQECFKFIDSLNIIRRATNLNDNKTLILHPATTIFCEYSEAQKREMQVSDSMLRLSAGIEDVEDIIADINQGLEKL
jgi:O-acetylhomoserine (thiol)-lyase